jgi:inosine/xanthosine triphosphate pyrophosphatase family protein
MNLISIKALCEAAKARGFDVREGIAKDSFGKLDWNGTGYAEIFAPDHEGRKYAEHGGAVYCCAAIIISDGCNTGYGYNPFFYGPFHPGLCRSTCSGVQKLLSHPAMADMSMAA